MERKLRPFDRVDIQDYRGTVYKSKDVDAYLDRLDKFVEDLMHTKTEDVLKLVTEKMLVYGDGFVPVEHALIMMREMKRQKVARCEANARWCQAESNDRCLEERRFYKRWAKRWKGYADKLRGLP